MKVERLVPDPRRPGTTRVVVGGNPVWTVPTVLVEELGLLPGAPLRGADLARLERAADAEGAYRSALRHLERRGHSRHELSLKLARKGHPELAIEFAIARLERLGLLDDAVYARAYVASRAGRGRSPARIRRDLHALGVSPEASSAAVATLRTEENAPDPLARTLTQARRRASAMAGLPIQTRKRRLLAFFARRGWGGGEAREHVEALLGEG